ncbi:MAG: S8/S53 family peptidase [Verrucomicrobiaceae bacterium]
MKKSLSMEQRIFIRVPCALPASEEARVVASSEHKVLSTGWRFKHVIEAPTTDKGVPVQWYVAWYDGDDRHDRDVIKGLLPPWKRVRAMAVEIAEAAHEALGVYPQLIEPGLVFNKDVAGVKGEHLKEGRMPIHKLPKAQVGALPDPLWPSVKKKGFFDPVWHLDEKHSQLAHARDMVRTERGDAGSRIKIGILDNGFDDRHVAWPAHVEDELAGDAIQALLPEFTVCDQGCQMRRTTPGKSLGSHGTGAIGILAGRKVMLVEKPGSKGKVWCDASGTEFGAAPDAKIVTVRVAPEMLSLSTANFAYGLDYASRVKKCDVLSMSHGGSPSQMWADAVNAAYDRGTAMFSATGDYFCFPLIPGRVNRLSMTGLLALPPPSSTVYPAAFRRVMGVAGVTAGRNGTASYALTDRVRWLPRFWKIFDMDYWMRGSYGGDAVRRSLTDASLHGEREKTDPPMQRRHNELRANPISAYAPAIPWMVVGGEKDTERPVTLDLDGGGTSSATPQAAAAAAHWLAYHKNTIPESEWRTWRKAEAVYAAMVYSALRPWEKPEKDGGKPRECQAPDPFLGAGILKACDMLEVTYEKAKSLRGTTLAFPHAGPAASEEAITEEEASKGMPRDYYDGERSYYRSVISPVRREEVRGRHRAEIREGRFSGEQQRGDAYDQLFFNMLLVEQWQLGMSPIKKDYEKCYPRKGFLGRLAGVIGVGPKNESDLCKEAAELSKKAVAMPVPAKTSALRVSTGPRHR